MKIYEVGGAVRDELLGLPVQDRDYVVVGATPEEMVRLGFRPVGKDFPVFLHPKTNDEYALARTERKTARGYKGFQVYAASDVTLEQDLLRRDLTINAIAKDEAGRHIDPHRGIADLRAGILRHVSAAFIEDPVRVLRVARFAARYPFSIAPETMALMREMVRAGEVDALVPERVWQEFAKGLMEANPARMFEVLEECGALARVLPEWTRLDRATALGALQDAAGRRATLVVRFAVLFTDAAIDAVASASERLRPPADCRDLAMLLAAQGAKLTQGATLSAEALVALFHAVDAWRRPERFDRLLDASRCVAAAERRADHDRAMERIRRALSAAVAVDAGAVARAHPDDIPGALRSARVAAVESALA